METADLKRLLESQAIEDSAVRGIVLRHRNKAEAMLKEIIESDPECDYVVSLLVHVMEADARYEEAEGELAKGIERCTSSEDAAYLHYIYGQLMEHQDHDKAAAQYLKAMDLDRRNDMLVSCATGLWRLGMERKARKFLQAGMRQLKPGDPMRTGIKRVLGGEIPHTVVSDRHSVPKLCRQQLRMPERVLEATSGFLVKNERTGHRTSSMRDVIAERFVNTVRETGNYADVLLSIDDERRENPTRDTNPDGLALDRWLAVLNEIKLGFELALAEAFFKDKCGKCRHPQGQKSAEGLSTCPLDYEFREYLYEVIGSLLGKVRSGVRLESALAESLGPMQDVPEWIRRRYLKSKGLWNGHA